MHDGRDFMIGGQAKTDGFIETPSANTPPQGMPTSAIVRAGVVVGMPCTSRTSAGIKSVLR